MKDAASYILEDSDPATGLRAFWEYRTRQVPRLARYGSNIQQHDEAMALAEEADALKDGGDITNAQFLYLEAMLILGRNFSIWSLPIRMFLLRPPHLGDLPSGRT